MFDPCERCGWHPAKVVESVVGFSAVLCVPCKREMTDAYEKTWFAEWLSLADRAAEARATARAWLLWWVRTPPKAQYGAAPLGTDPTGENPLGTDPE